MNMYIYIYNPYHVCSCISVVGVNLCRRLLSQWLSASTMPKYTQSIIRIQSTFMVWHHASLSIRAQFYKGDNLQRCKSMHVEQPMEVPGLDMRCPMKVPPPKLASTAVMCEASTHNDQRKTSFRKEAAPAWSAVAGVPKSLFDLGSTKTAPSVAKIFAIKWTCGTWQRNDPGLLKVG